MDVQMPGMDGLAATREIRRIEADEGRVRTPVMALTANAFESDEQRSLEAGCDAHLTKPLSRQRLIDAMQALISRGSLPVVDLDLPAAAPAEAATAPALLPSEAVDMSSALAALNDDRALYQRLLAHARVFMGAWNQDIAAALSATDAAPGLRLVHDLRSIAVRIGANSLSDAAASLDAALRFGDVEGVHRARALVSQRVQEALSSSTLTGVAAAVERTRH